MAWAALNCAVHAVTDHHLDGPIDRWRALRADIHRDAHAHDPAALAVTNTAWFE
ncbi:hypothetical protein [Prauserella cavernicola]|uniref:Uncharacterized protein n=1 Tax=Prauserella cavernicola TaxID=2800127 RepID=A0A934QX30_9PSEU|nr:hypothetical protein [Prauserella cavernicola]MBK1787129.1 hypothetical protein [Prauserella cavernicola]